MPLSAARWTQFNATPHPWEQDALHFLREQLADVEPNRVWSLFEFISAEGTIGEVDALVLTAKGFFLVEIKSRPGRITGDAASWTWHTPEGKRVTDDSPVFATDRKCKRLISLLRRQKALRDHDPGKLFLQPLVFLSATTQQVELDEPLRRHLCTRTGSPGTQSLRDALTRIEPTHHRHRVIDVRLARDIAQALAQAGIRESQSHKRFANSHELVSVLLEGAGHQDWLARHLSSAKVQRRIRIYPVASTVDIPTRQMLTRAAQREFFGLRDIDHRGILRAVDFQEGEQGPGVIFDYDPDDVRLDLFLRDEGDKLNLSDRLSILRQIAEATQHAHERRLVHRALTPHSVLIRKLPNAGYATRLYNWQTSARESTSATALGTSSGTVTRHIDNLVDQGAIPYLAPETHTDPTVRAEHLDVFGLGTIAWHLFTGRAPADSRSDLLERLRRDDGLLLSSAVDNVHAALVELVRQSTRPRVPDRLQTVRDFLHQLDEVENELTRPADLVYENPTAARVGQRFEEGGWVIKNRLGQGSTSVAFLVERSKGGTTQQRVLKVALDPEKNGTLQAEYEVLKSLHQESIIECDDMLDCAGHTGLLLARAGEESVATRLRKGRLEIEMLQRFGEDLLSALRYLEENAVFHRDIKPDNLGIAARGRGDYQHLVLFDFSLSRAPLSQIQVGTRAYLDPMLGQKGRRQYDPAAERYAAAVTLFEMATARLPKWGDGLTAPELSDREVDLSDEGLFDSSAREALTEFFTKALRRDAAQRFDNAEEMRRAWRRTFESLSAPAKKTEPEKVTPHSSVQLLGLSTRALTTLERAGIDTVRQLLTALPGRITKARGVGAKTGEELLRAISSLRAQFPDIQPGSELPAVKPRTDEDDEPGNDSLPAPSLDQLAGSLLPAPRSKAKADQLPAQVLVSLLSPPAGEQDPLPWPTQTEVAKVHGCTTVLVNQTLAKARARWRKNGALSAIRDALLPHLVTQVGIASIAEAVDQIAQAYGDGVPDSERTRYARIVLRAAIEAEQDLDEPRFEASRRQDRIWLVANQDGDGQPIDADALLRYAQDLGRRARELAYAEPLPAPARVLERLQQTNVPDAVPPLSSERLVRLAAVAGDVAVSGKLEVYPRGMPAARALKLAHGALLGAAALTPIQIRDRIASRYPAAEALPAAASELRPLLQAVVPDLQWDGEHGTFRFRSATKPQLTGERTLPARVSTGTLPPAESPEVVEAREFDQKLVKAREKFLVLTVLREHHETVLHRLQDRFGEQVRVVSCERVFLEELRRVATKYEVAWSEVLAADADPVGSPKNRDLREFVREVASRLGDVIGSDTPAATVLVTRLGVLARYGLLAQVVQRLRERVTAKPGTDGALGGAWLLVAAMDAQALPVVDGVPVPVPGSRSDFTAVPPSWVHLGQRERAS
ncbi:MAG: BREX system serine/threonine kinase PglW [Planctomycetota bacterium]